MTLLNILQFPDPGLKKIAAPVADINKEIKKIIDDMFETMYQANGVGLAAIQVDIQKQIIVIDCSQDRKAGIALINPVIIQQSGTITWEEGCLSFPGVQAKVKRFVKVTVEYLDLNNTKQIITADGLLGVCLQHEIDHLKGITFYDRLSTLKKTILREKLKKLRSQL